MQNKKIIFMGTPVFAAHILEELIKADYNVGLVVSQPDKKQHFSSLLVFLSSASMTALLPCMRLDCVIFRCSARFFPMLGLYPPNRPSVPNLFLLSM